MLEDLVANLTDECRSIYEQGARHENLGTTPRSGFAGTALPDMDLQIMT